MRLLVSVSNAEEASAALAGGADLIDAKDPSAGPLGAVSLETFHAILAVVGGTRPVTAALGDAADPGLLGASTRAFAAAGASLVKVGFAGTCDVASVARVLAAAQRGAATARTGTGVVAVAYADAPGAGSIPPDVLIDIAAAEGARGLLIDTWDKAGPGLRGLLSPARLRELTSRATRAGLLVALAGRLLADHLPFVAATGADIAGVRGAACRHGRTGTIDEERVRTLRAICAKESEPLSRFCRLDLGPTQAGPPRTDGCEAG